jgi:hypothetical protein
LCKFLILTVICCLSLVQAAKAQIGAFKIVQFSGIVMTSDSLVGIPYVTIYNRCDHRATTAREDGYFSFVAKEGDTIQFMALGFLDSKYYIPKGMDGTQFSAIQLMTRQALWIDTLFVYPYPTKEAFARDFVHAAVPNDQIAVAQQNLERERWRSLDQLPMDGPENYAYNRQQALAQFYHAGQLPPQNIFNVMAWAKFIEAWKNGSFKRKTKPNW